MRGRAWPSLRRGLAWRAPVVWFGGRTVTHSSTIDTITMAYSYYADKTTVALHEDDRPLLDAVRRGDEPNYLVLRRALRALEALEELEVEVAD